MYGADMMDMEDGCGGHREAQRRSQAMKQRPREIQKTRRSRVENLLISMDQDLMKHEYDSNLEEKKAMQNLEIFRTMEKPPPAPVEAEKPTSRTGIITVGKVIPWRKNSSRTISRAGAPTYYGVYVQEVDVRDPHFFIINIMALGEWNLPSPKSCLFCVIGDNESWDKLAQQEHQLQKASDRFISRFDRATWRPREEVCSKGYYEGQLVLPRTFLTQARESYRESTILTFSMRYAAATPWKDDYAVMNLLEITKRPNGADPIYRCPRNKHPISPQDAWKAVFPTDVLERFATREVERL